MTYLIDTAVLVDFCAGSLSPEQCPELWEALDTHARAGTLKLSVWALEDAAQDNDWLLNWTRERRDILNVTPSVDDIPSMQRLVLWAGAQPFDAMAQYTFIQSADSQLVGWALSSGATVVTTDTPASPTEKRLTIPDACKALGVECIAPDELLRRLGIGVIG